MNVAHLQLLYDYSYWANRHLFRVLTQLPAGAFTTPVAGSYGSIRNTMVHMLSAEWGLLDRCGGPARGPSLKAEAFPDIESVVATWSKVEGFARQFLCELTDDDLSRVVDFQMIGGGEQHSMRMGELLHHSTIHTAHHRGQVTLLLRLLGQMPGDFDILFYYAERAGAAK